MSDFDKLLEQVARRVCLATTGKAEAGDLAAVRFVLRDMGLAELLRQGDDAAFERHVEAYARGSDSHRQSTFASCTNPSCVMYRAALDKQKQAAMGGRCSTDQK